MNVDSRNPPLIGGTVQAAVREELTQTLYVLHSIEEITFRNTVSEFLLQTLGLFTSKVVDPRFCF